MSTKLMEEIVKLTVMLLTTVTDDGQRDKINHYSRLYPKVL